MTTLGSKLAILGTRYVLPLLVLGLLLPGCDSGYTVVTLDWDSKIAYRPRATIRNLTDGRRVRITYGNGVLDRANVIEVVSRDREATTAWFKRYLKHQIEHRATEMPIDPQYRDTFGTGTAWCIESDLDLNSQGFRSVDSPYDPLEGLPELPACGDEGGLLVDLNPLTFDPQPVGVLSGALAVTLVNNLPDQRKCLGIVGIEGEHAGDFQRPPGNPGTCVQDEPDELRYDCIYLDPGGTCTVNSVFAPTDDGVRRARLVVNDGGRAVPIDLLGAGVGGILQVVEVGYGPTAPAAYLPVAPGDETICVAATGGGAYDAWVRVSNIGMGYVTLPSPVSVPAGWSVSWLTLPPPGPLFVPLAPGATTEFRLSYSPPSPGAVPSAFPLAVSGNQQGTFSFTADPQPACATP